MKKICVVTGSRAEYDLLRSLMQGVKESKKLCLKTIVTGSHLSPEFGHTVDSILEDGFFIDKKVEMLLSSDSAVGATKSVGIGLIGFADAFDEMRPDFVILLGDRYEILAAATAALFSRIPIIHIHGGELTRASVDDAIRHSITKMAQYHFVATDEYRRRVIQLGEQPENVFLIGGLGADATHHTATLPKAQLEEILGFKFQERNLLVTLHPETLSDNEDEQNIEELFNALRHFPSTGIIFTMPNADPNGRMFAKKINNFCDEMKLAKAFKSLGQKLYFSCIKQVDGVVGNSSSGLLEVPSFKKGVVNIGNRQQGRETSESVVSCAFKSEDIIKSINHLYSNDFRSLLLKSNNPYATAKTAQNAVKIIEDLKVAQVSGKTFHDL